MKKNYSLVLLGLLATTTIALAMEADDLEGDKKRRFSSKLVPTLGDGIDVTVKGNKRRKPSSEPASTLDDAVAGSGEGGDSSYSQSVLPTTLTSGGVPQWDDQIMKEAKDVLAVMRGAVSTDTRADIYDILSFSRNGGISFGDEKLSADGLKTALSAFSTLDAQVGYIDKVFGSFFAKNPHLVGLEPSPEDDGVGGSGYSSSVEDDGLYAEEPEATSYGFRADDDGAEDEDDDDHLGYVDYDSDGDEGAENNEGEEGSQHSNRSAQVDEDDEEEDDEEDNDEDEGESDGRSSSRASSGNEAEAAEYAEAEIPSIMAVLKYGRAFDDNFLRQGINGILVCLHGERIVLAEGKPTVDMLRQKLSGLSTFKEQLDYIDELGTAFIRQNPGAFN